MKWKNRLFSVGNIAYEMLSCDWNLLSWITAVILSDWCNYLDLTLLCILKKLCTVLCNTVGDGSLPGCDGPTAAAVFVWWITNRVCCEYNSSLSLRSLSYISIQKMIVSWRIQFSCDHRTCLVDQSGRGGNVAKFSPFMAGDWSLEYLSHWRFSLNTCWWVLLSSRALERRGMMLFMPRTKKINETRSPWLVFLRLMRKTEQRFL